jgi:DNA polymerase III delta prime subunit
MKFDKTKSVWYQRYLPQTVDDVILPDTIKAKLKKYVESDSLPALGFWSAEPGLGKSSTCNAIIKDLGCDALFINSSMERSIDILRNKIQTFAGSASFIDKRKLVVMDEFDNFTRDGMDAFRAFLDEYSANCAFIFTGNYKEKVKEPLLNRLENYDFMDFKKEEMIKPIFERLCFILDNEGVKYEQKDLAPIIKTFYPSIRKMVGALQRLSVEKDGKLVLDVNEGSLDNLNSYDELMELVSPSTYFEMISKVNSITNVNGIYSYLYHNATKYFREDKLPQVVVILAKYQDMSSQARDLNLNLSACLTELMSCK